MQVKNIGEGMNEDILILNIIAFSHYINDALYIMQLAEYLVSSLWAHVLFRVPMGPIGPIAHLSIGHSKCFLRIAIVEITAAYAQRHEPCRVSITSAGHPGYSISQSRAPQRAKRCKNKHVAAMFTYTVLFPACSAAVMYS